MQFQLISPVIIKVLILYVNYGRYLLPWYIILFSFVYLPSADGG